jgi:hypothetical protein
MSDMIDRDWRCCGCGCNPPFECQCATDVAWKKNADGKNEGLSKSEYRRGIGLPSRAALPPAQPDAVEALVKAAEKAKRWLDVDADDDGLPILRRQEVFDELRAALARHPRGR